MHCDLMNALSILSASYTAERFFLYMVATLKTWSVYH